MQHKDYLEKIELKEKDKNSLTEDFIVSAMQENNKNVITSVQDILNNLLGKVQVV